MCKVFIINILILLFCQTVFSQNPKPPTALKIISAERETRHPGTPVGKPYRSGINYIYKISVEATRSGIVIDKIYYNQYQSNSEYKTSLAKGELYFFQLNCPIEKGATKMPIKNIAPNDLVFRYWKNKKAHYLIVKNFVEKDVFMP